MKRKRLYYGVNVGEQVFRFGTRAEANRVRRSNRMIAALSSQHAKDPEALGPLHPPSAPVF